VTSELNVLSTGDAPLQWVVGAYYLDENIPLYLMRDNYNTVNFVSSSSTILTESDATSQALFGQINYRITDRMELIWACCSKTSSAAARVITGRHPGRVSLRR
jgi:iron complex outermembrane receptor protein